MEVLGGDGDTFFSLSTKKLIVTTQSPQNIIATGGAGGYFPNFNAPELNNLVDAWVCPSDYFSTTPINGANTRAGF